MLLVSIVLAVVVPISYLYVVHWLNVYGSDRPRTVMLCFGWGLIAFLLSFAINRSSVLFLGFSVPFVGTRTAPFVEEVFKAVVLVYLVRRAQLTYFVDGAIYGFASGIGFAAIENLRYIQRFPDSYFATTVIRDFSTSLGHGMMTALTGIALGSFVHSASGERGWKPLLVGLAGAMTLHYAWNNFAYYSPFSRFVTEWILVGVALTGLAAVGLAVLWGLKRERAMLHESLGLKVGVSDEEASVLQHMDDLDALLEPIEKRFGAAKRRQVEDFLHVEAQLGLAEELEERTTDPKLRAQLAADVANLESELDRRRRNVGVYVMLYVRSIFPRTAWSLWVRLAQALARRIGASPRVDAWRAAAKLLPRGPTGNDLHARVGAEIAARERAEALSLAHVHALPDAMQKCMHWVMAEVHVTAEHVAAGLGHHETHAHAMLSELAERGFLHRTTKDGAIAYRARPLTDEARAARPHVWQAAARNTENRTEGGGG